MPVTSRHHVRERGFTLIELLVVVSVIMILMSIVLPALQGASAKARQVKCLSNLGQLAKAVVSYSGNNEGFIPSPAFPDTIPVGAEGNDPDYFDGDREKVDSDKIWWYRSYTWRGKIQPFLGARNIEVDTKLKEEKGGYFEAVEGEYDRYGVFHCPSVRDFRGHKSFYGMNGYMAVYTNTERLRDPDDATGALKVNHYDDLLDTARTLLFGENNDGHWIVKPKEPGVATDFKKLADQTPAGTATFPGQLYGGEVYPRHSRRACWVYTDAHTDSPDFTKLHEDGCFLWLPEKP